MYSNKEDVNGLEIKPDLDIKIEAREINFL